MFSNKRISITHLKVGKVALVVDITGGQEARRRLEALGVRLGKNIVKTSAAFLWGPITVRIAGTQIGIGHGLASKIIVEIEE